MKASSTSKKLSANGGFTLVDLLIVMVVGAMIVSLMVGTMGSAQKSIVITNAAQQFATYVQQARSDSKKLHATAAPQMAQLTILNDRYYTVTLDSDGNGVLDPPIVISLEDRHVKMDGPFPRTFMFDWLGRALDSNQKLVPQPEVKFENTDGTGNRVVQFADAARPNMDRR